MLSCAHLPFEKLTSKNNGLSVAQTWTYTKWTIKTKLARLNLVPLKAPLYALGPDRTYTFAPFIVTVLWSAPFYDVCMPAGRCGRQEVGPTTNGWMELILIAYVLYFCLPLLDRSTYTRSEYISIKGAASMCTRIALNLPCKAHRTK